MYEAVGKMKWIGETQSFASGFIKREFVVTTAHDKYPQDLKFEVVKDKCAMLESFACGQDVQVSFDIRGNEYNGKYFVNLSCWKLQSSNGAASSPAPSSSRAPQSSSRSAPNSSAEPAMNDLRNDEDFDDEPPF